jgi:DNA repair protein RadC
MLAVCQTPPIRTLFASFGSDIAETTGERHQYTLVQWQSLTILVSQCFSAPIASCSIDEDIQVAHKTKFYQRAGGKLIVVSADAVLSRASDILRERLHRDADGCVMQNPVVVREFLRCRLAARPVEVFGVMFLDTQHRLLAFEELFYGTLDGATVYPREVVRRVLVHNAGAVILVHNHPSGVAEPSTADRQLTSQLKEALALINVRVLDHLVVTAGEALSLAEKGFL